MPLDRNALAEAIKKTMKKANDEKLTADQVAEALADAIHVYTSAAQVIGVSGNVGGISFSQVGAGRLQ